MTVIDPAVTCRSARTTKVLEPYRPGEIEGLKVSLAGTEDKLAQIHATLQRRDQAVHLGMPAFPDIAGRSVPPTPGGTP